MCTPFHAILGRTVEEAEEVIRVAQEIANNTINY